MKINWIAIVFFWYCTNAFAYNPVTHVKASDIAAKASLLADRSLLSRLGLQPQPIDSDIYNAFYNSESNQLSILELIKFGAKWEDTRRTTQGCYHFLTRLRGKVKPS